MSVRLINGDCIEEMQKLIDEGVKVDLVLTDPPYGITACKWDNIISFDEMWDSIHGLSKERTPTLLFGSEPFSSHLRLSNLKEYKYDWVWAKPQGTNPMLAKKQPLNNIEYISVFYEKQCTYNPQFEKGKPYKSTRDKKSRLNEITGTVFTETTTVNDGYRYPKRILNFKKETGHHPTQKPVHLLKYLIKTYTNEGDIVLDFTMGSGSTGVACQELNRNFIGIELDEKYFEIAKERCNEYQNKLE